MVRLSSSRIQGMWLHDNAPENPLAPPRRRAAQSPRSKMSDSVEMKPAVETPRRAGLLHIPEGDTPWLRTDEEDEETRARTSSYPPSASSTGSVLPPSAANRMCSVLTPRIVLLGLGGVGKSAIINELCGGKGGPKGRGAMDPAFVRTPSTKGVALYEVPDKLRGIASSLTAALRRADAVVIVLERLTSESMADLHFFLGEIRTVWDLHGLRRHPATERSDPLPIPVYVFFHRMDLGSAVFARPPRDLMLAVRASGCAGSFRTSIHAPDTLVRAMDTIARAAWAHNRSQARLTSHWVTRAKKRLCCV